MNEVGVSAPASIGNVSLNEELLFERSSLIDQEGSDGEGEDNAPEQTDQLMNPVLSQLTETLAKIPLGALEKQSDNASSQAGLEIRYSDDDCAVGLDQIPKQVATSIARTTSKLTILIAGDSGLGKSTFINTLFEPPDDSETTDSVAEERTKDFKFHRATLKDKNFCLQLTVIDTPGFVEGPNKRFEWVPVGNYLEDQMRISCFQEEQPKRHRSTDTRVHACIYFLTPTLKGLTESDIIAMSNLTHKVNLIPVISKADSFTKSQIESFKEAARNAMKENDIKPCEFLNDIDDAQFAETLMPFSIIGSDTYVEKPNGEKIRGRAYNWGIAEIENDAHCDFNKLKSFILSTNTLQLIDSTNKFYEEYRSKLATFRLEQYAKLQQELDIAETISADIGSDIEECAIDKIKLQEKVRIIDLALKNDNSLEYTRSIHEVCSKQVKELLADQSPIYLDKAMYVKKNFANVVSTQELRFKEWKSALLAKQKAFNKEIQSLHKKIVKLQEELNGMEEKGSEKGEAVINVNNGGELTIDKTSKVGSKEREKEIKK